MTLIKLIVACFVGIGSFLIGYSNSHVKLTYHQLKKFLDYLLTKHCFFN